MKSTLYSANMSPTIHVMRALTEDIQELCDEFYIETRHIEKLNELMKERQGSRTSGANGDQPPLHST